MAYSSSKRLWEHLKEQQEPFILHICILERRMIMSNHTKKKCICNLNKRQIYTKKILKLVKCSLQDLNYHKVQKHNLISKLAGKLREIRGAERCSEIDSSVAYHDFSICGINDSLNHEKQALHLWRNSQNNKYSSSIEKEVAMYTNKLWESEENKQLKPRSFLDEAPASSIEFRIRILGKGEEGASSSSTILTENAEEDSISPALLPETEKLNQAEIMELNGISAPGFLELPENKSVLQQSEQLLFDCTTESKEIHERKKKDENCTQGSPGLVELEKKISWRNQKPTQKKIFDVSDIIKDWNYMQQVVKRKIGIEVGDFIMDKVIQEVVDLFLV